MYWKCGDYALQRTYLAGLMERYEAGRNMRCRYWLNVAGKRTQCCQKSFTQVHGITTRTLQTFHASIKFGNSIITDGRGKNDNRPHRNGQDLRELILQHINQYEVFQTHYGRRDHAPHYLSSALSLRGMFRDFKQAHPEIPNLNSKEWLYRYVFEETGLQIGTPQNDTCNKCDKINVQLKVAREQEGNDAEIREIENLQTMHHALASAAQEAKRRDVERSQIDTNFVVKIIDMQQVAYS